ncbi:MAG: fatty-acid--CoA ligase [Candidatus Dormibacteraeota bacterium]|nr:fatty-acid--CoA ligase [Candidatus Dormibacteraeota bacterium]
MSLVLAADYRVPDFDRWCAMISGDLHRLPSLGAHHLVVYRSVEDPSRVFTTLGVRERGPVDVLLRSPVLFAWFDSAGVEEIPPLFVGEVVEKLDLAEAAAEAAQPGAVIVAAIVSVAGMDRLRARVRRAAAGLAASGVRRFWIYQALDDQAEAMILQEVASERQAQQWIRHPAAVARFMSEAGVGAHPPLFVGRLVQTFEVPAAPRTRD